VELSEYLFEPLREDEEFVLYRGHAKQGEPRSVLLLAPVSTRPILKTLKKIDHEYSLRSRLDSAWAVRPLAIAQYKGQTVLVLEDLGGEPLNRFMQAPMEMKSFLRFAVNLAAAVKQLHKRGLLHKDVKPANALVDSATYQVRLTGFGVASRHPRERQSPEPPEFIAGTLAYMAPEQTGRMNRSIDSRSDLYSLGISFYEMLTGKPPFAAPDPMEWVHCHVARRPAPPTERVENIPPPVSAIIMKLLAKTAEERYQTAAGVESDLRLCLLDWEARGRIDEFSLGEHDTPDHLLPPEKLYGRVREIDDLLASFDRVVVSGVPELVLVSGYSGIGKSSVVNELHKVLVPPRGLFASGKFDQFKRDIPYATLAQAFQSLVRRLLGKSQAELQDWRNKLQDALGPNGLLIVDLVPELKLIIGEQPPVPPLPLQDAQCRFQLVFRRFINVFARTEHPLALFLDDLQWLDAATLDLLEDLLTRPDVNHLLLIGAYRDNEVNPAHPLMRKLETIRQAGAIVQDIVLAPLAREDLALLIADSVHSELERAAPLAQLIHEKTAGNPFFAIQFISALAEEGLLTFNHDEGRWSWDLNRIHTKAYTDNVVDLIVGKLNRLPLETQNALKQLACLGNSAEFAMLRMMYQDPDEEIHAQLWEAVRAGFIFRSEDSYRFLHDRVQEAAYSLIPEEMRSETHLRIGMLLAMHTAAERLEDGIFEIVNQLNRGSHLIASAAEREQVANLNLIAGRRAKSSTAYASALKYLAAGRAPLTEGSWEDNYELIFNIEFNMAECELLTAELETAERRLSILAKRARSGHDIAIVTRLRLTLYTTLDRSDRGVEVFLEYLQRTGTDWPLRPTRNEVLREYDRIWSLLGNRQIEDLVHLPLVTRPDLLDLLDVFTEVVTPSLLFDENLCSLVICRMVNLSLEHGNCDAACFAYVWLAIIAGPRFGNYKDGFRFGRLGYELVEKRGLKRYQARTYMSFGNIVMPWAEHAVGGRDMVRRAFDAAYRIGDLTFAAYSWNQLITNFLTVGDPLADAQPEAENGLAFAQRARFGLVVYSIAAQVQIIRMLRGLTPKFGCFNDEHFDELHFEHLLASSPVLGLPEFWYWARKVQARFFAGDYASAVDASSNAQRLLWTSPSQFETAEFRFYGALSQAGAWDSAFPDERQKHFEALAAHHKQLEIWAQHCPTNFENRAALVSAEIARIEGRVVDAEGLYEKAIRSARANGFTHNEAVAYEVAARFYATRGFDKIVDTYLREARYCYLRWGATAKVRQLDDLYPHLKDEKQVAGSTNTIDAPVEHQDLATIIKVSQSVSAEMVLEKLIDTLMRTAIEHAGAERGVLILQRGNERRIAAEATISGESVLVHQKEAAVSGVPESIVRFVTRTREHVILDDAAADSSFSADTYIRQRRARSVLCLPLINQGKSIGLLYLENSLSPGVFTPNRIAVLKLLASQAAISLENSRLYSDLEEREAKIRRLVDANIMGVFIWNLEGKIVEGNEAFLHMVGYGRQDLSAGHLNWRDLTPPEWRDRDERALIDLHALGSTQPYEKEFTRKDSTRVPVLLGGALCKEGGSEGLSFVLDLSEQKRAEQALRRSEAYLAEAQKLTHTGTWAWDAATKTLSYSSEEHRRLYGFDSSARLPSHEEFLKRMHPEDRGRVIDAIEKAVCARLDCEANFRILLPDGTTKYMYGVGHPVFNASGDLVEYVGITTDVTERVRTEEERERMQQLQADLAYLSRVTTMGELTASLAHEIRQPITAALTDAKTCLRWLARDCPDVQEAREAASRMIKDVTRAADIIASVSQFFKKGPPQRGITDVNELIREMIVLIQSEANRYSISIHTELAEELPGITADRVQLQQVFMNLMLNGIDAMKERAVGGELRIKSEARDGQLSISVSDTGAGIPPDQVDHIFDAFFTTKRHGIGMGLPISRSIIESHGGRLWATNSTGQGATFQFTLPIVVAARA